MRIAFSKASEVALSLPIFSLIGISIAPYQGVKLSFVVPSPLIRPYSFKRYESMDIARITVDELNERTDRGEKVALVDARSTPAWGQAGTKLPGAIRVPPDEIEKHIADVGRDRLVVTYCT
jgi:hypothetical protein